MAKEVIRLKCPLCGMMCDLDRIKNEVAEVRIYLQKFGGKRPTGMYDKVKKGKSFVFMRKKEYREAPKMGRGQATGYMEYIDITDTQKKLYSDTIKFLKEKIKRISL